MQFDEQIFTSVVVYSRTPQNLYKQQLNCVDCSAQLCLYKRATRKGDKIAYFIEKKKKNGAHTNSSHNCAARRTQYSRRLLSILARPKNKKPNTLKCWLVWHLRFGLVNDSVTSD